MTGLTGLTRSPKTGGDPPRAHTKQPYGGGGVGEIAEDRREPAEATHEAAVRGADDDVLADRGLSADRAERGGLGEGGALEGRRGGGGRRHAGAEGEAGAGTGEGGAAGEAGG